MVEMAKALLIGPEQGLHEGLRVLEQLQVMAVVHLPCVACCCVVVYGGVVVGGGVAAASAVVFSQWYMIRTRLVVSVVVAYGTCGVQ